MAELKIISEKPLSLMEVKNILTEKKKRELTDMGAKTLEYINSVTALTEKKTLDLIENLKSLNIPRLKEKHIKKIADILPKDIDSLRAILASENTTLKQEEIEKILTTISSFIK